MRIQEYLTAVPQVKAKIVAEKVVGHVGEVFQGPFGEDVVSYS